MRFLLIICFLLCSSAAKAADYTESVMQGDVKRAYLVHIPDAFAEQKNLPVVIVMHGGGGNAAQVRGETGMDAVADKNGFIAVYPEGTAGMMGNFRTWNAGLCCGSAVRKKIDDVSFISAMIDNLVETHAIDRTRVYATGHSNGAMMSYRLACELSDKIAAIAPNAGQRILQDCHPVRAVPMLHIHGTADPCALYSGGKQCGGCFSSLLGFSIPNDTWPCEPVETIVKNHAALNGCSTETETVFTKGAVTCTRYKGCPANAAVELCAIAGAGHRWAGAAYAGSSSCRNTPEKRSCQKYEALLGPKNDDINAGEFMWEFFKNFHLP